MSRSDWIALLAAVGTFVGLVPAFGQYLRNRERQPKRKRAPSSQPPSQPPPSEPEKPMPAYIKALFCTSLAFVIFVIELVTFTWIGHFFGVPAEFDAMSLPWRVGFMAIFLVPGLLLCLAFLNIMSTLDD